MDFSDLLKTDGHADVSLFDQIRVALIEAVRAGALPAGTRLPTVRELASQLGLAVNTVARAYRELEAGGVVETRGRFGTFVASSDPAEAAMTQAAGALRGRGPRGRFGQGRCAALPRRGLRQRRYLAEFQQGQRRTDRIQEAQPISA